MTVTDAVGGQPLFDRVLIANRGEIAVRIARTLRRLGIQSIGVYSDADAGAPHTRAVDTAVRLGAAPAASSYLSIERIIDAALLTGADAVHPGYGFVSENADFARACADAGLVFIGPSPAALQVVGDKIRAKEAAAAAGLPIIEGGHDTGNDDAALLAACVVTGFPALLKPAAGGGGKGMRIVAGESEVPAAIEAARREARAAFGDDTLLVERYLPRPRHIEVQVFGDRFGTVVHLGERECSLQRRHQKIVEEAPSVALDDATRRQICDGAVRLAASVGYVGAGTVEFLVSSADPTDFAFLEMNARLQVEHPVTEMVTGLDLVEWQLRIAAGQPIPLTQDSVRIHGHAVEARIYAEDPRREFVPTGGDLLVWRTPTDVRVDSGVESGMAITSSYDPMLAKVIVHEADRGTAWARLDEVLADTVALGVQTNIDYLRWLVSRPEVLDARLDTGLVERLGLGDPDADDTVVWATAMAVLRGSPEGTGFAADDGWRLSGAAGLRWDLTREGDRHEVSWQEPDRLVVNGAVHTARWTPTGDGSGTIEVDGIAHRVCVAVDAQGRQVWVHRPGRGTASVGVSAPVQRRLRRSARHALDGGGPWIARSPMPGTVVAVAAVVGNPVEAGAGLAVVEAMKMEHVVRAPRAGVVSAVRVSPGQQVRVDEELVVVDVSEEQA